MNIGVSAFFLLGVFQLYTGTAHLVGACIAVYLVAYFRIGGKRYMPWIVSIGVLAHMLYTYVMR